MPLIFLGKVDFVKHPNVQCHTFLSVSDNVTYQAVTYSKRYISSVHCPARKFLTSSFIEREQKGYFQREQGLSHRQDLSHYFGKYTGEFTFTFLPGAGWKIFQYCLIVSSDEVDHKRRLDTIQENGFYKKDKF